VVGVKGPSSTYLPSGSEFGGRPAKLQDALYIKKGRLEVVSSEAANDLFSREKEFENRCKWPSSNVANPVAIGHHKSSQVTTVVLFD
jgi:hypothetical protein